MVFLAQGNPELEKGISAEQGSHAHFTSFEHSFEKWHLWPSLWEAGEAGIQLWGSASPGEGFLLGKNKNQKFVLKKSNLKSTEIQIS